MNSDHKTSSLLVPGENCWRVEKAEKISFLVDAAAYFEAFREAVKLARKTVFICGWDIDSRLDLLREDPEDGYPRHLRDFLDVMAGRNKDLQIYILIWDFAMLLGMKREWFSIYTFDWKTHRNVHFAMDDLHPVGASHHQKIVVIDDSLAFVGGLDLTKNRWDTPAHDPADTRRISPDKETYRPNHDVQMMVSGRTAASLGEFFRQRWELVNGKSVEVEAEPDVRAVWPDNVKENILDGNVGIARTRAPYKEFPAVREVEKLYLDTIGKAKKYIYIENQYLTAPKIFGALAESLRRKMGPEIIIVLPLTTDGWLSQYTMDVLRKKAINEMRRADHGKRLGVFYAHRDSLEGGDTIKIHSKLMIADDIVVRIGSSNLNNRSMGLDTECDLVFEADGNPEHKKAVAAFCSTLLAEHLAVDTDTVQEALEETGSRLQVIQRLQGNGRTLKSLEVHLDKTVELVAEEQYILDPEEPIEPERFIKQWVPLEKLEKEGHNKIGLILVLFLGIALALAWRFTPLNEMLSGEQFPQMVVYLKTSDLAWLYVSAAYVIGAILVAPITVLITLTLLIYGSVKGVIFSILGACVSGAITYWLGRFMGRKTVRKLAGNKVNRLSKRLGKSGIISTFIVRLIPIAPYSIVNIVAGASHIRFRDFMLGTVLGMLPGTLAIAGLVDRGFALFNNPGPMTILSLLLIIIIIAAGYFFIQKKVQEQE